MKLTRTLLFAAIIVASLPLNLKAQANYDDIKLPFANDSLIYEEFDAGAWSVENTQKYVAYPDRRPDYAKIYSKGAGVPYVIYYLWDSPTQLAGFDLKISFGGQPISVNELRIIRDANGRVIETISKQLDQPGLPLVNNDRTLTTYNAQNKVAVELSQDWDDNLTPAAWVNSNKSTYTYDGTGKLLAQLDSGSSANQFVFSNKYENEYDANGKLKFRYTKNSANVATAKTTYTYNTAGFLTEEIHETISGPVTTFNGKDSTVLDANNRVLAEYHYNFDFNLQKSVLNSKMTAGGSAVGILTNKLLKTLMAYPNPSEGLLTLKLNNSSESNVEVYDIMGAKVMEFDLGISENKINLTSLSNGIYTVKVKNAGETYQNKVILNK